MQSNSHVDPLAAIVGQMTATVISQKPKVQAQEHSNIKLQKSLKSLPPL